MIWIYRLIETFCALVLVVLSIAFWKLYTEPMDAKFLLPELAHELLPRDSKYTLRVESAVLSAGFQEGGLFHLNMRGLQIVDPDDAIVVNLPTVNLSYGLFHILTLNYIPDKLIVERPDLRLLLDEEGHWHFQKTDEESLKQKKTSAALPDMGRVIRHMLSFDDIAITDGVLLIEDLAKKENLSLPQFELHMRRSFGFNHVARFKAVAQIADHLTDIQAKATYRRFFKNLNIEVGITPVYVSRLGRFSSLLQGIDVPVSISLSADFKASLSEGAIVDSLKKMKFQVKALDEGTITLPSPIYAVYPLKSAEINGAISAGFKTIKIAESRVVLKNGTEADLVVTVRGVEDFLKKEVLSGIKTNLEAKVRHVPMAEVPKVWPKEQGADAHEWVVRHLSKGQVSEADFQLWFEGDELKDVLGIVHVTGATVDYLPKMPAIENVSAEVVLKPHEVLINADKGNAGKVDLVNAALVFDLNKEITDLSILLNLKGPIAEMLQAINQKPLSLLKGVDFDWNKIQGAAETEVKLLFPLDEATLAKNLKVDVSATSQDVKINLPNIPLEIEKGKVYLFVNNSGLQLDGSVMFQNQPLSFMWQEDFTPVQGTNSFYALNGQLTTKSLNKIIPDIENYLSGSFYLDASVKRLSPHRMWQGTASIDLKGAKATIHPISVVKEKQEKGTLNAQLEEADFAFSSGKGSFELRTTTQNKEVVADGSISWGKNWSIVLNNVRAPLNDFRATVSKNEDKFTLDVSGKSWNLSKLMEMPALQKEKESVEKTVWVPHISLKAELDKLFLNPKKAIEKVIINGERTNNLWKYFQAEAVAKEPFVIVYNPEKKEFQGEFADLGSLMAYLGISERFVGGHLWLLSKQEDSGLIRGKITVEKTELNETGFLLQAVSILGIVDAIRGKNLVFDEINIPFEVLPEGEIKMSDAYAASSNLGVTFHGFVNLNSLHIEGAVIPAYAVNSLPGKIPLIGALFREGDGGGLLGVKYSVKGTAAKPEVEFHPLSSMMPGALGYIF